MEEEPKSSYANLPQALTTLPEGISHLFNGMISSDSNLRQAAEGQFDKIPAELKPSLLLKICKSTGATEELRSLSLDRLSRLLKNIIHTWSSDDLTPFSEELIEFALSEKNDKLIDKLIDVIVQVTKHNLNSGVQSSPTIISFMKQCSATECPSLRKIALSVIVRVPNLFGKYVSDPRDLVEKCLMDRNVAIRCRALEAFFAVINENTIGAFSTLLPLTFQTFEEIVVANEDRPTNCPIASLAKLAAKYPQVVRPHLKAIVNVCTRAVPETNERMREGLTLLLDPLIKDNDNANIDVDMSSKIAHFTLNCAPFTTNDVKRAAMHIVYAIPHAFGNNCASVLLDLFKNRLNDDDLMVRMSAVGAFPIFVERNAENEDFMKTLCTLLPRIIELAEAQAAERDAGNNALYDQYYGPFEALDEIINSCLDRILPHRTAMAQACINLLCKLNTGRDEAKGLTEAESRHLSATFKIIPRLFQVIDHDEYGSATVIQLCQQLTRLAYSEMSDELREECIKVMARVAIGMDSALSAQSWSEVHRHIMNGSRSPHIKAITIQIIQQIVCWAGNEDPSLSSAFHDLLESDLLDANAEIRRKALEAFAACSTESEGVSENAVKCFSSLIPTVLKLTASDENAEEVIQCLETMAEQWSPVIHSQLAVIFEVYCKTIQDPSRSAPLRLSFSVSFSRLCLAIREKVVDEKCSHLANLILSTCLTMLSEFDENVSVWAAGDYHSGWDHTNRHTHSGERSLVLVLDGLNKEMAATALRILIDNWLSDADWRKRHAALMALSMCKKIRVQLGTTRLDTAKRITPLFKDQNCRIRFASAVALLRIGRNCPANQQKTLLETVVPALLSSIEDETVPRVAAQAAASLAQFCKDYSQSISPHLDAIMRTAVGSIEATYQNLLSDEKTGCLVQAFELLCSMKDTGGPHYAQNFDRLIGPVKLCLDAHAQFLTLHSAALNCFSLIASAVGRAKCLADVTQVMRALLARFDDLLLSNEGEFPSSFARLVSLMGDSFLEFLPVVMTPILTAIQSSTVLVDENGDEHHLHDIDLMLRKRVACKLVVRLACVLGGSFLPYVMELAVLAIAHLTMPIYRTDRDWAAEILPALLASVKARGGEELVAKLWTEFARVLKHSLMEAGMRWAWRELEVKLIRSTAQCMEMIECLSDEDRQEFADLMKMKKEVNEERKARLIVRRIEEGVHDSEYLREQECAASEIGAAIEALNLRIMKYY